MNLIPCLVSNHIKNTCDTICLDTWNESHSPNETNKSFRDKCIQKMKPQAKECFASVIMVDISGYSSLCSTHSTFEGTEELSRITLDYLDKVNNVRLHIYALQFRLLMSLHCLMVILSSFWVMLLFVTGQ